MLCSDGEATVVRVLSNARLAASAARELSPRASGSMCRFLWLAASPHATMGPPGCDYLVVVNLLGDAWAGLSTVADPCSMRQPPRRARRDATGTAAAVDKARFSANKERGCGTRHVGGGCATSTLDSPLVTFLLEPTFLCFPRVSTG